MSINENNENPQSPWLLIIVIITVVILSVVAYYFRGNIFSQDEKQQEIMAENTVELELEQSEIISEEQKQALLSSESETTISEEKEPESQLTIDAEEEIVIKAEVTPLLLDESDSWFEGKFEDLTWRKELIKLIVTDDIIRKFVVFTENFSRGLLAYQHTPVTKPKVKFNAIENGQQWLWDEHNTERFKSYVELLRSIDKELLIQWYIELKPVIDIAYAELGYDDDFSDVLQIAISKVLDMEIPKSLPVLERPSVMFTYQDEALESLDDVDKLLLRLGKENLLVIKSILLEINEKLIRVNED